MEAVIERPGEKVLPIKFTREQHEAVRRWIHENVTNGSIPPTGSMKESAARMLQELPFLADLRFSQVYDKLKNEMDLYRRGGKRPKRIRASRAQTDATRHDASQTKPRVVRRRRSALVELLSAVLRANLGGFVRPDLLDDVAELQAKEVVPFVQERTQAAFV